MGREDDSFVPLSQISPHLIAAVISTEDSGFFVHSGFEEASLKEAVLENLREGAGRGGSTITQQLAKNLFLSGERTIARKLKEAVIAWRLESDLPKDRILEIYLNIAEWGPGLYGARAAADHYFHRTARVLRPEEAAFLASLLPSPIRYHGYYHSPRGLTQNRYSMVQDILRSMHRMGRLNGRDYHLARGEPIELGGCRSSD
jgi:monofunctional biosynthetic peptidoglycan transglycosylase